MNNTVSNLKTSEGMVVFDQAPPEGGVASTLPMMIAIMAIFYFMLIRPQQKEQKALKVLLTSLKKGDRVVTATGMHGKVWEVGESEITLEISDKTRVVFDKVAVKRKVESDSTSKES